MIKEIGEHFQESVHDGHLIIDKALFMNARDPSSRSYGHLRDLISKHAKAQPNWGEELPMRWLLLFSKLNKMAQNGRKIISKKDLRQLNTTLPSPLQIEEIDVFLNFHHSLGHILYFQCSELQDTIVLDPTLVVDAFRSIITSPTLCQFTTIRRHAWSNLKQGIIKDKQISALWACDEFATLEKYHDPLIAMMSKLDLLVKPKCYKSGENVYCSYFVVPSMIQQSGDGVACEMFKKHPISQSVSFVFKRKLLPVGVFSRLLAACMSLWPIERKHLYYGMCLYDVDQFHSMLICKIEHVIHLSVHHKRKQSSTSQRLRFGLQSFIQGALDKIMTMYPRRKDDMAYDIHNAYPDLEVGYMYHDNVVKVLFCT